MKDIKLIRKIAWSFHKTTGYDWDDLFQEAAFYYVDALKTYDPKKGALSTHVWIRMQSGLINFLAKENKYRSLSIEDTTLYNEPSGDPEAFWLSLSGDANLIAKLVLSYSQHFVCLDKAQAEQRVVNILTSSKVGWSMDRVINGLTDLENAINLKFV